MEIYGDEVRNTELNGQTLISEIAESQLVHAIVSGLGRPGQNRERDGAGGIRRVGGGQIDIGVWVQMLFDGH